MVRRTEQASGPEDKPAAMSGQDRKDLGNGLELFLVLGYPEETTRRKPDIPMNTPDPADLVAVWGSRERRAFVWTCGWVGVAILAYSSQSLTTLWLRHVVVRELGSFDLQEYHRLVSNHLPLLLTTPIILLASLIGFSISLVRWLVAMRKRRHAESQTFQ